MPNRNLCAILALVLCLVLSACGKLAAHPTEVNAAAADACAAMPQVRSTRTTIVLYDKTTVADSVVRVELERQMADEIKVGQRFVLYAFGGIRNPNLLTKLAEVDLPGAEDERRLRWSESPIAKRRRLDCRRHAEETFLHALSDALNSPDRSTAGFSPVFDAIGQVLGRQADRQASVRLWLLSDGISVTDEESWYWPRSDRLRLPDPEKFADQLERTGRLPDARGVAIDHVLFGMAGMPEQGNSRAPRPRAEVQKLRRIYETVYRRAGATASYGEPLLTRAPARDVEILVGVAK